MKRVVVRVLVFLVIGMAINVAVAWACVICFSDPEHALVRAIGNSNTSTATSWPCQVPEDWPSPNCGASVSEFGLDTSFALHQEYDAVHFGHDWTHDLFLEDSGWPLRSMRSLRTRSAPYLGYMEPPSSSIHFSSGLVFIQSPQKWFYFPVWPLWVGTVMNSLVFAAAAFASLEGFSFVRAWHRRHRNLCPHCSYPIGASPVCTECGKPIPAHALRCQVGDMRSAGGVPAATSDGSSAGGSR